MTRVVILIASATICFVAGWFSGVSFFIFLSGILVIGLFLWFITKPCYKPIVPSVAIQTGFIFCHLYGLVGSGDLIWNSLEIIVITIFIIWLLLRPSLWPVISLAILHTLALMTNLFILMFLPYGVNEIFTLIFRILAIIFMFFGLYAIRNRKGFIEYLLPIIKKTENVLKHLKTIAGVIALILTLLWSSIRIYERVTHQDEKLLEKKLSEIVSIQHPLYEDVRKYITCEELRIRKVIKQADSLYELGDYTSADSLYTYAVKLAEKFSKGKLKAITYICKGNFCVRQKNYRDAIKYFEESLKYRKDIEDADIIYRIHSDLGFLYFQIHDYTKSILNYTHAIYLCPKCAKVFLNRGLVLTCLGLYKYAMEDFTTAIEFDPNLTLAFLDRGLVYWYMGLYEKALLDFNTVIERDPELAIAYSNRGCTYSRMRKFIDALKDLNKAIHLDSQRSIFFYNRGNVYAKIEKYNLAVQDYSKAIELEGDVWQYYYNRGLALIHTNRVQEAIPDFTNVVDINPGNAEAMELLGWLYLAKDDTFNAHYWLKRAMKLKNRLPDKGKKIKKWFDQKNNVTPNIIKTLIPQTL